MPANGEKGAVDQDLKFKSYENLYTCDSSAFPCSPVGNLSLTLAALARIYVAAVATNTG
jgi:choline dehydrogenase-like flavoprotein